MFKKSIMTLAIIAISATSMGAAASAKGFKVGWGGHHHNKHYFVKTYKPKHYAPKYYAPSCRYYKKKWKWTGSKHWKKKYKACLILKY